MNGYPYGIPLRAEGAGDDIHGDPWREELSMSPPRIRVVDLKSRWVLLAGNGYVIRDSL